jgi:hypothetical protein
VTRQPYVQRPAGPRRVWLPPGLPADWNADASYLYSVVDEKIEDLVTVSFSSWPLVDEEGRLSFAADDPVTLVFDEATLSNFLAENRKVADPQEAPSGLVSRELRVGDVFAVRPRPRLARVLRGKARQPPRGVIPDRWLLPPIYDVTSHARDAAKLAYYAAAAALLPESTIEAEIASQLQPDRYDVLGPLEGTVP